jgi:prepilin-type N-terminal cleavage/methylation domain-containing protein
MRPSHPGFTLIELLIVISIIGVLAAVLLPAIIPVEQMANAEADRMQLRRHHQWLTIYQQRLRGLPTEGGHRFVLSTWTSKIFDHTEEALDAYFSPGSRDNDPDYRRARQMMEKGVEPWPDLDHVTSTDTHYVGRAREHLRSAKDGASEAWMATDNEGLWVFPDGTINVLFHGGNVRDYSYQDLMARFGLGDMDRDDPVPTWGVLSPIPECQKLAN